jgi:hypothetical protein
VPVTVSVSVTVAVSPRSVLERFFGVLQRPTHRLKLRDPRGNHQIGHPVRIARAIACHRAIDAIRATIGIGRRGVVINKIFASQFIAAPHNRTGINRGKVGFVPAGTTEENKTAKHWGPTRTSP